MKPTKDDGHHTHLHQTYLRSLKKEKRNVMIVQLIILMSFFGIWEMAARNGWIDQLLFSMPSRIFTLLVTRITDGTLMTHTSVTLFETVLGFIIGTQAGKITD